MIFGHRKSSNKWTQAPDPCEIMWQHFQAGRCDQQIWVLKYGNIQKAWWVGWVWGVLPVYCCHLSIFKYQLRRDTISHWESELWGLSKFCEAGTYFAGSLVWKQHRFGQVPPKMKQQLFRMIWALSSQEETWWIHCRDLMVFFIESLASGITAGCCR